MTAPARICFFFNAQLHQLMHAMPIAIELSHDVRFQVDVLAATPEHIDLARLLAQGAGAGAIGFSHVDLGWLGAFAGHRSTPPKLLVQAAARRRLARYDALVVPERTSLRLKKLGLHRIPFIHTMHGAGDRAVGLDPRIRKFDFVLLAGEKQRRRMLARSLIRPGAHAVVGYPKFDVVGGAAAKERLFANDRPVVLYNPHFCRGLSSWDAAGEDIIGQFAEDARYNLVVAPHVRLFDARRDRARAERRLARYAGVPNIRIDLGSRRSIDMSYVRAADIYLGDVSSQVYEFLAEPRPCLFLNTQHVAWAGDDNYAHWRFGAVIEHSRDIVAAVDRSVASHSRFLDVQRQGLRDTFVAADGRASIRAASAIGDFLLGQRPASASVRHPGGRRLGIARGDREMANV